MKIIAIFFFFSSPLFSFFPFSFSCFWASMAQNLAALLSQVKRGWGQGKLPWLAAAHHNATRKTAGTVARGSAGRGSDSASTGRIAGTTELAGTSDRAAVSRGQAAAPYEWRRREVKRRRWPTGRGAWRGAAVSGGHVAALDERRPMGRCAGVGWRRPAGRCMAMGHNGSAQVAMRAGTEPQWLF